MYRILILLFILSTTSCQKANDEPVFKVVAFFTGEHDLAHISFINEAHDWFNKTGEKFYFEYDSTNNWSDLNTHFLSEYDIVLFLDTRPENSTQRQAFEQYMNDGGAWIGFHFAGFSLSQSAYDNNWKWYHDEFLGSGEYKGNTWRPTSANLKIETHQHQVTADLPDMIQTAPNEWYSWQNDLTQNPDIRILASIDSSSFPLGTGPKEWEIWHEGYYPVMWTNTNFNMIYFNMGHNDMDYEGGTNEPLSSTFSSSEQNQMLINALLWLGREQE